MKNSILENLCNESAKLGLKAFNEGKSSVPYHDLELQKFLKDNKVYNNPKGYTIPVLDAWIKAWHKANIDASVTTE